MMNLPTAISRSIWLWLGLGLLAVYLRGLWLDVMDVDAAQYASISMEMLQNGHWLEVMHRGADYLDKPPLVFWFSASSFALFGISNWAYKLPSLLAAAAGVWAVYRFCLLFYDKSTARLAAFILASSMGLMVICNDVRTDTLLLGFSACAVWQIAEYLEYQRWRNLWAGFFFIGLAMLAKGPIGLVATGFAVGTHLLLRREWGNILRWQWLPGLALTALTLAPMCWGLWQQFDLHPEKLVNGRYGVSGLRFFFWEQSFGRITGENVWKNDAPWYYFMHVYLWAFLPWCLLLPAALWTRIRAIFSKNTESRQEWYSLGGFLLTFAALSMSQYKLPHYIFITLPWAAILVAGALQKVRRWQWILLYLTGFLALALAFLTLFFIFPENQIVQAVIALAGLGTLIYYVGKKPFPDASETLVSRGVAIALIFGFVLNFHFYPHLLPYQSPPQVARYARSQGIPPEKMYFFQSSSHTMDFYNGAIMPDLGVPDAVKRAAAEKGGIWVFTTEGGKRVLEEEGVKMGKAQSFSHFQVALLNGKFLNPATRTKSLGTYFLIEIPAEQPLNSK